MKSRESHGDSMASHTKDVLVRLKIWQKRKKQRKKKFKFPSYHFIYLVFSCYLLSGFEYNITLPSNSKIKLNKKINQKYIICKQKDRMFDLLTQKHDPDLVPKPTKMQQMI